jgi:DNA helicase-2/ATP-dependent DNA helicase PcrA
MVNKVLPLKTVLNQEYPQFLRNAAAETLFNYLKSSNDRSNAIYDDLLVRLKEALEMSLEMREQLSEQYRDIMVDEYQDTNKLQAQIVKLMTARQDNVAVVGDEFQSIYSFRGASHKNMLEFPKLFPSAQIIKLEENYRSTQPILNVANAIMDEVKESFKKRLFRTSPEEKPVVWRSR